MPMESLTDADKFVKDLEKYAEAGRKEVKCDLLLIVADKPTNYSGLSTFTKNDLRNCVRAFVQARHPEALAFDINDCIAEIEKIFSANKINILTFEGLKDEPELSESMRYYTSEWSFQGLVYHVCEPSINKTVDKILARPSLESAIFRTWVQKIIANANPEHILVTIDVEEFKHYIRQTLEQEVEQLDAEMIKETLVKARAAYIVEGNVMHPFWFYARQDFKDELRKAAM